MVPLTTLSELENKNIPVTISPPTPGKFKWISTRTLQFIPTSGLYGSAHYSVDVSPRLCFHGWIGDSREKVFIYNESNCALITDIGNDRVHRTGQFLLQ